MKTPLEPVAPQLPAARQAPAPAAASRCPFSAMVPGLPLLGNTLQFLRGTTEFLLAAYRQHGPVFRIRMLWLKFTVILGFEARQFMLDGGERHLERHSVFDPVGAQLGSADFALAVSGDKHLELRRLLQLAYSREVAGPYVPQFIEAVQAVVREWPAGSVHEVFEGVQLLAFEQYCRVMGNCSLREHYRDCRTVTDMNMEAGGRVLPLWFFHWPPYRAARRRVLKLVWGLLASHRDESIPARLSPDIVDTLLALRFPDGRPMTDDEVVCYTMYGFAGSCSYMGRLVAFMLYELFRHPDWLGRITEEVDRAFARGLRDAADVGRMQLLRAFYHETLRFHPVSQGMPYVAREDFEFAGRRVAKGDLVVLSQLPMLFSPQPFTDPERFDPARCLEPRSEHRKLGAFNPFGMHHRTCAAMGLVELMALTMVATLVHELDLEMFPAAYQLGITVKPLPAPNAQFRMRVRRRPQKAGQPTPKPSVSEEVCLAAFPGVDKAEVVAALQEGRYLTFPPGTTIIRQGDQADAFYLVTEGMVEVLRQQADGSPVRLATLAPGDYFGEIGLLTNSPRNATVRVVPERAATVLALSADAFRRVVAESDMVSREIARVVRKRATGDQLRKAVDSMDEAMLARKLAGFVRQSYAAGQVIIRQGDPADRFFFLYRGKVTVSRRGEDSVERMVNILLPGQYFGETGMLHHATRNATVTVADEAPVVVFSCDRQTFDVLVHEAGGPEGDLAQALAARFSASA